MSENERWLEFCTERTVEREGISEIDLVTLDVPLSFHLDFAALCLQHKCTTNCYEIKVIFRDATNSRAFIVHRFLSLSLVAIAQGFIHIVARNLAPRWIVVHSLEFRFLTGRNRRKRIK